MTVLCSAELWKTDTSIGTDCPGYKLLYSKKLGNTGPDNFQRCCESAQSNPDCGNNWFIFDDIEIEACFCEIKGYDCQRIPGPYEEYRFTELSPTLPPGNATNSTSLNYFNCMVNS